MEVVVVVEQLRRAVPGGVGTYADGLLRGLRAGGDTELRVHLHASRAPGARDPLASYGYPVHASRLPGAILTRAWDRGRLRAPLEGAVLHATSLAFPPPGRSPLAVTVHDLAWRVVPSAYPRRGRRWHERSLRRASQLARLFVVPSAAVADALVAAGVAAARVEVVEEGADHLPAADLEATDALLDRLGVRGGFLLTVGTLEPRKNLRRLVTAYAAARAELPESWPLVVVGPTGWGRALPPDAVPTGVVLAGPVEAAVLAGLYRRARCFAYVPLVEGFGLPPVEAMRECTPVVASPVPSVHGAALEVDPTEVGAIAKALVAASTDDRARSALVTAGLLRSGELTWEAAARRHVELWTAVAEAP